MRLPRINRRSPQGFASPTDGTPGRGRCLALARCDRDSTGAGQSDAGQTAAAAAEPAAVEPAAADVGDIHVAALADPDAGIIAAGPEEVAGGAVATEGLIGDPGRGDLLLAQRGAFEQGVAAVVAAERVAGVQEGAAVGRGQSLTLGGDGVDRRLGARLERPELLLRQVIAVVQEERVIEAAERGLGPARAGLEGHRDRHESTQQEASHRITLPESPRPTPSRHGRKRLRRGDPARTLDENYRQPRARRKEPSPPPGS